MDKTFSLLQKRMKENLEFSKSENFLFSKKVFLWIKFYPYRFFIIFSFLMIFFMTVVLRIDIIKLTSILQFGY